MTHAKYSRGLVPLSLLSVLVLVGGGITVAVLATSNSSKSNDTASSNTNSQPTTGSRVPSEPLPGR